MPYPRASWLTCSELPDELTKPELGEKLCPELLPLLKAWHSHGWLIYKTQPESKHSTVLDCFQDAALAFLSWVRDGDDPDHAATRAVRTALSRCRQAHVFVSVTELVEAQLHSAERVSGLRRPQGTGMRSLADVFMDIPETARAALAIQIRRDYPTLQPHQCAYDAQPGRVIRKKIRDIADKYSIPLTRKSTD